MNINRKLGYLILIGILHFSVTAQNQIGNIIGDNAYSGFGSTFALSGNGERIITSAPKSKKCGINCGEITIYEYVNNGWKQLGETLLGAKSGDYFGSSIAISDDGTRIIVSSPHSDKNGYISGCVKVYEWSKNKWIQLGDDIYGEPKDMFGSKVKISGDGCHIAIGSPFSQNNDFVRVYKWKNKKWIKKGQDLKDEANSEYFGASISLSSNGNRIAFGVHNPDKIGCVKVFDFKNNKWVQIGVDLKTNNIKDGFGGSVSLSGDGNTVAIGISKGNKLNDSQVGIIEVFRQKNGVWLQIGGRIYGENPYDLFGQSIELSYNGNRLIGSSIFNDVHGVNSGQVRLFEYKRNSWKTTFTKNGTNERDYLGKALSISSKGDVISASSTEEWLSKQGLGSIKIFKIEEKENTKY